MRLLHVLSQLPDQTGSGIYLQSLLREGATAGLNQYVVAAANQDQEVSLPWLRPRQLDVVRFGGRALPFALPGMSDVMPYRSSRFSDLSEEQLEAYLFHFEQALRHARRAHAPELVHVNHLWLVAALCRRVFPDLPVVASCHGTGLRQAELCPHLLSRVQPDLRKLDRVLALTEEQAERIAALHGVAPERIVVSGGAVNTRIFGPPRKPRTGEFHQAADLLGLKVPRTGLRLIYVGKLSLAKGVGALLDAAELLQARGRQFSLLLVGSGNGPEAEAIEERARRLCPPVYLLGRRSQQQVADLLRGCHIFVLPSFFEGLPLSALEALVCGCRVVVSDLPGLRGWPAGGELAPGLMERVPLPEMEAVDRPRAVALPGFVQALTAALERQMERAAAGSVELEAARLTGELGWDALFRRIQRIYRELLGAAQA